MLNSLTLQSRRTLARLDWARSEAQYALITAGVPTLLAGTDIADIAGWIGAAEYEYKTPWWQFLLAGEIGLLLAAADRLARQEWAD